MEKRIDPLPLQYIEAMSEALKVLSHPQRLRMLELLDIRGECCAGEIFEALDLEQSAVSQHLAKMRQAGIITCRSDGTKRYFRIANEHSITILNCMRNKIAQEGDR
ncbi:MAG: ArsR/SmtB family transcription factor [Victivallaceae bacterium]|nr:metalloregulator ArsR/SmtB family transcription factor [Victivallaceae bacterium]